MTASPFPFSDTNKRYHTFSYFAKHEYGGKTARIPLDAGFSCPSHCIFCASGSSGAAVEGSIAEQYAAGVARAQEKWQVERFIPYLQANTNTYAPVSRLTEIYAQCARLPGAVALAIATRADCLTDDVIDLLVRTAEQIPLIVELGMQSAHDATLSRIGRGYGHDIFVDGYTRLCRAAAGSSAGKNIRIALHLMNGLPGESAEDMRDTAREVARLRPDMVKLHTLCVLRGTPLADVWAAGGYTPLSREAALEIVCDQLTLLPPETVIARVSADAPREILLAPLWTRDKRGFENALDARMKERGIVQGEETQGELLQKAPPDPRKSF